MSYRRLPNSWESPGAVSRASWKTRNALRSREETRALTGAKGTQPLSRRYYPDMLLVAKAMLARHAAGGDVRRELAALGGINVGRRGSWRQLSPDEVICLVWPPPDISPRDLGHPTAVAGKKQTGENRQPDVDCPGGCGEQIRPTYGKCAECAGRAALEHGARRGRRR